MQRVRELSCWGGEDIKVKPVAEVREELALGEGRTNQNFIVESGAVRSFVRIGADLPYFGVSRPREQAAAIAAHAAGIAPRVRHAEPPDALVVDFVSGRALTEDDMHAAASAGGDNAVLANVAAAIRTLHRTPVPEALSVFLKEVSLEVPVPVGWGGPHLAMWWAYAVKRSYSRLPLLTGLEDIVAKLERAAGPLGVPRFCHFDLLADNLVMRTDGGIALVDFEYTAPGQPLMDLAVLAMGCNLNAAEERNFLAAYLEVEPSDLDLYRFKAIRVLAALRETFWGVTAELSESSALSMDEARSYCDMNFAKFKDLSRDFEATPEP